MPYDDTLELRMKPEALQAFLEYKATHPEERSFRTLADSWVALHGGKSDTRRRQLERWSAKYRWQDLIKAWDKSKDSQKARQFLLASEVFDANMVAAGEGMLALVVLRLKEMIEEDQRRHAHYLIVMKAAMANPGTKAPSRPRPQVGPMVLATLLNWGASESRQAHASRVERVGGKPEDFAGEDWPDLIEVTHSIAPPPEPSDPDADLEPLDEFDGSDEQPDLPPALVRLSTRRPRMSPDEDDEDDD